MGIADTAIILCGGKSSRMGFDKSKIKMRDKFLIELMAEKLGNLFDTVIFVAEDKYKFGNIGYPVIEDVNKGKGPAGGILTGLKFSPSKYTFFTACDMPFINLEYINYMFKFTDEDKFQVVMAQHGPDIEPLYSFYSKELIPRFENCLHENILSIRNIIQYSNIKYIPEDIQKKYDKSISMFTNLNYKDDLSVLYDKYKIEFGK